jgi:periplasmic divalent cation tolerance protein
MMKRGRMMMKENPKIVSIMTTLDDKQTLENICRVLVEKKMVACAQVSGPIKSLYWWNGSLEETEEWVGTMKTRSELYQSVEEEIVRLHPYEVPEIMGEEIAHALPAYTQWVRSMTAHTEVDPL